MKPVFQLEKEFIERKLNIELPPECWRNGSKIYLNLDKKTKLLEFTVADGKMSISKDYRESVLSKYPNISWDEEINNNKERLERLEARSIKKTIAFIKRMEAKVFKNHQISFMQDGSCTGGQMTFSKDQLRQSTSSGKDSDVCWSIVDKAMYILGREYTVDHLCTSNDTADTNRKIKSIPGVNIVIPPIGFYPWLTKIKKFYLPTINVRNCCSHFKEDRLKEFLSKDKVYVILLGVRKYESNKRSYLDYEVNKAALKTGKELNVHPNWHRFAPIVEWRDEDVWLYILKNNIKVNPMYHKGFNRVGCLICPFSSGFVDLLIQEYYPKQWARWVGILAKNYEMYGIEKRLKWTFEEWKNGKWKTGQSKEQEIIKSGYNEENISKLAELKGVSKEIAEKFFVKACNCCGDNINPTEIAMSYKFFGRKKEVAICKTCFIDTLIKPDGSKMSDKEYVDTVVELTNTGCELF